MKSEEVLNTLLIYLEFTAITSGTPSRNTCLTMSAVIPMSQPRSQGIKGPGNEDVNNSVENRIFLIFRLSFRSCQVFFHFFFNFSPICSVYPSAAIFISCENDGLCFRVLSVFLVKNICINSEKCIGYGKQRTTTKPEACMCVTLPLPTE